MRTDDNDNNVYCIPSKIPPSQRKADKEFRNILGQHIANRNEKSLNRNMNKEIQNLENKIPDEKEEEIFYAPQIVAKPSPTCKQFNR